MNCCHDLPLESKCSACTAQALRKVERDALLEALRPLTRRKSGSQKEARVPLELVQRTVRWMEGV